ncbi:restriction endonuclease subunit S [Phytopseudomonas flavescens]|nr:restriction endonuclease subunit S [Pseudomonas flavescens]
MTALLTDNLPLLTNAPNGIKKLRELILELAVRGKLVPQDASDGQASDWLERIKLERNRLFGAGLLKKSKRTPDTTLDKSVSAVPRSWRWVTLSEITLGMDSGWSPACEPNPSQSNEVWGILKTTAVQVMQFLQEENKELPAHLEPRPDAEVKAGDILFTRAGPTNRVGISCLVESTRPRLMISDKIIRFHPIEAGTYGRYIALCLNSGSTARYLEIAKSGMAASQVNISQDKLKLAPVPLAPLPEQRRIVAKVDELMALCDRLEAQQADAERAHAQLVQALLDSLTQASDATDFAANWQRLAGHFHTLFDTEPSINALKQTLLQLAVMGKLVPQDPSDEPASELLRRVWEINDKVERIFSSEAGGDDAEGWFGISAPDGWCVCRVSNIAEVKLGSTPSRAESSYWGGDIPWVSSGEVAGTIIKSTREKITQAGYKNSSTAMIPPGCVLIAMIGQGKTRGQSALLEIEACTNQNVAALIFNTDLVASPYVWLWAQAMYSLHRAGGHGGAQPALNAKKVKAFAFPLPPTAEQHRIVAKVDQLMTLCDQLKTRLTQARQLNEQLASTLVERALVDNGQLAPVTTDQKAARTLLAAEITHQLHGQRTFGQRKLQKVIYLAEHAARLTSVQGNYLLDAAGPHDRQLMSQVENELRNRQWYECVDREKFGHAYRALSNAGQHRQAYESVLPAAERATIKRVVDLMRDWDTDRCEMTVTLYAAWNDFIIEGRPVTDDAIVDEVLHRWNDAKLRFSKSQWLTVLTEMKKHSLLTPSGFGKRTTGGTLTLPGFE